MLQAFLQKKNNELVLSAIGEMDYIGRKNARKGGK